MPKPRLGQPDAGQRARAVQLHLHQRAARRRALRFARSRPPGSARPRRGCASVAARMASSAAATAAWPECDLERALRDLHRQPGVELQQPLARGLALERRPAPHPLPRGRRPTATMSATRRRPTSRPTGPRAGRCAGWAARSPLRPPRRPAGGGPPRRRRELRRPGRCAARSPFARPAAAALPRPARLVRHRRGRRPRAWPAVRPVDRGPRRPGGPDPPTTRPAGCALPRATCAGAPPGPRPSRPRWGARGRPSGARARRPRWPRPGSRPVREQSRRRARSRPPRRPRHFEPQVGPRHRRLGGGGSGFRARRANQRVGAAARCRWATARPGACGSCRARPGTGRAGRPPSAGSGTTNSST